MKKISLLLVACLLVSLLPFAAVAEGVSGPVITVTVPADFEGELNGRLLFCVDTAMPREGRNVYSNLDVTGCEVVGKTVFGLHAGDTITLTADDPDAYGYPYQLGEIPAGDYAVQALFVVYTQFNRSDGVSIWGMADHGGGASPTRNPYNLYSDNLAATIGDGSEIALMQAREDENFVYVYPSMEDLYKMSYVGVTGLSIAYEGGTLTDTFPATQQESFSRAINQQLQLLLSLSPR